MLDIEETKEKALSSMIEEIREFESGKKEITININKRYYDILNLIIDNSTVKPSLDDLINHILTLYFCDIAKEQKEEIQEETGVNIWFDNNDFDVMLEIAKRDNKPIDRIVDEFREKGIKPKL